MKPRQLPSHPPFEPAEADIQKRAHFIRQEEGCPAGRDLEIWQAARELLRHEPAGRPRRPSPAEAAARHRTRRAQLAGSGGR